ncbi:MAG: pirin family protein [Melioribacteraceae bacterium]|nr:pirin family protein [Melioribacteraceae bacterium]MCF8263025.1 pirin family protein [Melioribacteraceae bacterium]MCF8430470.1 pirin family protein [Melioribacteraceae bacterium]
MKKTLHKSTDRGYYDHGWLKTNHSFSFASYYNPEKMQFGMLRVFNDDFVEAGRGFGAHPHEDMEIVSIPLKGELAHKDNAGHEEVIRLNDVQVMSAGTGIQHSEYNYSENEEVNFFQLWIIPNARGHKPRYDQKTFNPDDRVNKLQTFISPDKSDGNLWLNQDAHFSWTTLKKGNELEYNIHTKGNGVYTFVIEGAIEAAESNLNTRDAIGISETESFNITAKENSFVLFVEVPMN